MVSTPNVKRKGIILAGGSGTRLYPSTSVTSKQLLPIYDKPMIYYPLTTLIQAGINEILVITNPHNVWAYSSLFEGHEDLGLNIQVTMQAEAAGLPQAFIIGEDFIGDSDVCLVLGDNFYHAKLPENPTNDRATIVAHQVKNPSAYGVLEFNESRQKPRQVVGIVEKPQDYISEWAVTGLYYYPNNVIQVAKTLKPSARGELEITDVNQHYCNKRMLDVHYMPKGSVWLDAGTHEDLADATAYVRTVESRTGLKIGCYEEAAWVRGFTSEAGLFAAARRVGGAYGEYLAGLV